MTAYTDIRYASADARLTLYARDYGGEGMPVLCLHGLTRNSADFEALAAHLSPHYRVIVPDMRGRGLSDNDPEPLNYQPLVYVGDVFGLLGELGLPRCVIIGTSMGGIMAMLMANLAAPMVIGVVLNDVGPELDPAGLERIKTYTGKGGPVRDWVHAAERTRLVNEVAFPDYNEADWLAFAHRTYRDTPQGPAPAYDPDIAKPFQAADDGAAPPDMWGLWDKMQAVPVLAIRGELSDLLSPQTFEAMQARHPDLQAVTVPGRGHAPMLDEPVAVAAIDGFLQAMAGRV
ncbi:alpha/beta hydrolase [Asticcacaulis sp. EMRT-3]|uniref:alpha/beta fold hydrolase n=1 Tax=Asticcacaulis sp. EMRT-3 TaxID=3040349 RepID=UPI0024AEBD6D|nr:alpha/beta hydrolase [Asticcacaulis sp. EMRT-3]MDI7775068.1 alpha/beta hydrolase [Asticcacaulis sp. EMRT-3]